MGPAVVPPVPRNEQAVQQPSETQVALSMLVVEGVVPLGTQEVLPSRKVVGAPPLPARTKLQFAQHPLVTHVVFPYTAVE
jgi:hypothetical protein